MNLSIEATSDWSTIPTQATPGAAGMDLYAAESAEIPPRKWAVIDTGIAVSLPVDRVGLIKPRSGWAVKYGIDVLAGVIDSDYRDSIKVVLINHGPTKFTVEPYNRIAQMIIQQYDAPIITVVSELGETVRGKNGFGSTGV